MSTQRYVAEDVICRILAASGGRLAKKTCLNKAFYYAHLYYWKHAGGFLTGQPIVKAPNGPVVDNLDGILADMVSQGRIRITCEPCGPYEQAVFELLKPVELDCRDPRDHAVELAVQWVRGRTASELSEETHEFIADWDKYPLGAEMPIYRDLLDGADRAAISERMKSVAERLLAA